MLARRSWNFGLDVPFGFSSELDGALFARLFRVPPEGERVALRVGGQSLYRDRHPFIVTELRESGVAAEELAFPALVRGEGMDVLEIRIESTSHDRVAVEAIFSGKRHNLPAHARGSELATDDGYLVSLARSNTGNFTPAAGGLALCFAATLAAGASARVWLVRPYALRHPAQRVYVLRT